MQLPKTLLNGRFVNLPLETIYFGPDSLDKLPGLLDEHGVKRAVVVTGRSISNNPFLMDRLHSVLGSRLASVVGEARQHVPRSSVLRVAEAARSNGADGLISFGGGSPNDTAKAVAWALAEDIKRPGDFDRFAI